MTIKLFSCRAIAVLAMSFLAACGGGGGGSSSGGGINLTSDWSGIKQLGAANKDTTTNSVATDSSGNVYVAGYTTGGLNGNTVTGTTDAVLAKYSSSGTLQYVKQLGVVSKDAVGNAVATDSSGNIYVVGSTNAGLSGNTLTGSSDLFVAKYNSSGALQYVKQLGVASAYTYAYAVATDTTGNVYVTGSTRGGLNGNTITGSSDLFVAKYNSSGALQYVKQLGAASTYTVAYSITTDANSNVYVAGYTMGGLNGNTLTGSTDFFVAKYDTNGTLSYVKQLGATGSSVVGNSVAADSNGDIYVVGTTSGGLNGNTLNGSSDLFVAKYTSSGAFQYVKQLGVATASTAAYSVATDSSNNVYVTGATSGGLNGNTKTGSKDAFVAKYNASGSLQYVKQLGATGAATDGNAIATDGSGNLFVTGDTTGSLAGNALTGTRDFFLAKYTASGALQ